MTRLSSADLETMRSRRAFLDLRIDALQKDRDSLHRAIRDAESRDEYGTGRQWTRDEARAAAQKARDNRKAREVQP